MELDTERREALARLAGYAGQLQWAMKFDEADRRAEESRAGEAGAGSDSDVPKVIEIRDRSDRFSDVFGRFARELFEAELMDRDYAATIETLGGGRKGHELADEPSGCDVALALAVLTYLMRAERFVWGFWDDEKNREKLVRVLFHLRGLAEGRPLP